MLAMCREQGMRELRGNALREADMYAEKRPHKQTGVIRRRGPNAEPQREVESG